MASVDALSREEVWQIRGIEKKGRMVEAQQTGPRKRSRSDHMGPDKSWVRFWVTVESYWKVLEGRM